VLFVVINVAFQAQDSAFASFTRDGCLFVVTRAARFELLVRSDLVQFRDILLGGKQFKQSKHFI